jgi:hypothetical protein
MQYYNEEKMQNLRLKLEKEIEAKKKILKQKKEEKK